MLYLSRHATDRWRQRFPWLDPATELATARLATKRVRNLVMSDMFTPRKVLQGKVPARGSCRVMTTAHGVAMLVGEDGRVITVFKLPRKRGQRNQYAGADWDANKKPRE